MRKLLKTTKRGWYRNFVEGSKDTSAAKERLRIMLHHTERFCYWVFMLFIMFLFSLGIQSIFI